VRHGSRVVAALTLALVLAGAAAGAANGEGLRAFVLAGAPDSFADLQAHTASIAVAYSTYFQCAPSGSQVLGHDEADVSEYTDMHGVALMPRYSCQNGAQVHRLLYDRSLRAHLLAQLLEIGARSAYRGLCLDLENDGAADRALMTSFVAALARGLHALGKRLAVVVDGVRYENPRSSTSFYDDAEIAALADEVFVLAWGVHWERSAPGPIAPLPWVREVAAYLDSLPHARRFVLGVPMYGLDWATAGDATAYQYANIVQLAESVDAKPTRDTASDEMTFAYTRAGVRHTVFYLDGSAIAARLRVGLDAGLQVGVWRLGSEDQSLWSALP
jgi:spore germination protein YaaH